MLKKTKVGFQGIDELVVTFKADAALTVKDEGKLVKSTETDTVGKTAAEDSFLGQMLKFEDRGTCSVRMKGYFELTYSGTAPVVGYSNLVSDANGNVKTPTLATDGVPARIVRVDKTNKLVGFFI